MIDEIAQRQIPDYGHPQVCWCAVTDCKSQASSAANTMQCCIRRCQQPLHDRVAHAAELLQAAPGQPQLGSAGSNREGYALAAGMALGLITLGRGQDIPSLADLHLADRLRCMPAPLCRHVYVAASHHRVLHLSRSCTSQCVYTTSSCACQYLCWPADTGLEA